MAGDRIIDLGFADALDETERPLRAGFGFPRLIGAGLAVLACLAGFGAAAGPTPPAFTYLGTITSPDGIFREDNAPTLIGGLVMTVTQDEVVAFRPDGREAWRHRPRFGTPEEPAFLNIFEWEGLALLRQITWESFEGGARSSGTLSAALDPATGREIWRIAGVPTRFGDVFFVSGQPGGDTQGAGVYRSLPDGLVWTVPPARVTTMDPATDTLMTLTDEGLFTEYRFSTGTVRRRAELRVPHVASAASNANGEELTMRVLGDRLVVTATVFGQSEPVQQGIGYDRATLRPLPASPLDLLLHVEECGSVLCVYSLQGMYILDKDTLAQLWRTGPGEGAHWTSAGMMLQSGDAQRLVDERTGRPRADLTGWEMPFRLGLSDGPAPAVVIRQVGDRTYAGRLTPQGVHVLGSVPHVLHECQSDRSGLLLCRTDRGEIAVLRYESRM